MSPGFVDLHFHGAFGIDLMSATDDQLSELSQRLREHGLGAYVPTTLSTDAVTLQNTIQNLGDFIQRFRKDKMKGAIPLGIHLEGPFINPKAAGAHPPGILRPATLDELESLWKVSQKSLKIITLAPEIHDAKELRTMVSWARKKKIRLSVGHSAASTDQATQALDQGFTSVTHAWNAMPFHHRAPGVLGAALGRKGVYLEIIADGVHVDDRLTYQTCDLHENGGGTVCMVSDCAPAAGLPFGKPCAFGDLTVAATAQGCLVVDPATQKLGGLAGSSLLLPQAFERWFSAREFSSEAEMKAQLSHDLEKAWRNPLEAIGESLQARQVRATVRLEWTFLESSSSKKSKNGSFRKVKCRIHL